MPHELQPRSVRTCVTPPLACACWPRPRLRSASPPSTGWPTPPAIAALEAAIPDVAALVFACLGIALALHRRALRARTLNLASVAASVFMNAIAAEAGWRSGDGR